MARALATNSTDSLQNMKNVLLLGIRSAHYVLFQSGLALSTSGKPCQLKRGAHDVVGRPGWRHIVAQWQLESDEILKHRRDAQKLSRMFG